MATMAGRTVRRNSIPTPISSWIMANRKFQTPTSGLRKWPIWVIDHATGAGWPCALGRIIWLMKSWPNMRGWSWRAASRIQMHPRAIWTMRARCDRRSAGVMAGSGAARSVSGASTIICPCLRQLPSPGRARPPSAPASPGPRQRRPPYAPPGGVHGRIPMGAGVETAPGLGGDRFGRRRRRRRRRRESPPRPSRTSSSTRTPCGPRPRRAGAVPDRSPARSG